MISYSSSTKTLVYLLNRLRSGRLTIPDHQRDFVWSIGQQKKLVNSIRRNKPVPSILVRELDTGVSSLEDGQQRLKTLLRYVDNEFEAEDGKYFRDLTLDEQTKIDLYSVIVVGYSDATDEEAREIFNDYQNGKPLTVGERLYSMRQSPIIHYAVTNLLTPGAEFHDRVANALGGGRTPKGRRGCDMTNAYALCAGMAFGIDYLSRKWDDASSVIHKNIDEPALNEKMNAYARVWQRVHELKPVTTKARRNDYWNPGNYGGYIVYSMELLLAGEGAKYNLPASMDDLIEHWAKEITTNATLLATLHEDLDAARSWKMARWSNGLARMFKAAAVETQAVDTEDEDDAE